MTEKQFNLEFGTGGLRAVMGPGSDQMNEYTVGMATQGLANYILKHIDIANAKVVISYDCRNNSALFAQITAEVLFLQTASTLWEPSVLDAHVLRMCPFWLRYHCIPLHTPGTPTGMAFWHFSNGPGSLPLQISSRKRHYLFSN